MTAVGEACNPDGYITSCLSQVRQGQPLFCLVRSRIVTSRQWPEALRGTQDVVLDSQRRGPLSFLHPRATVRGNVYRLVH